MECDQCGAYRPRTGPCPECGAPPPGSYSSRSQWRGQAPRGRQERQDRGNLGDSGSQRGGSSARWQRGADQQAPHSRSGSSWGTGDPDNPANRWVDDDGYADERGAGRGREGRWRNRADDYEEIDLERALVPARGDDLMPMDPQMGVPALPGFPATDAEERALGIRRPVYIPATGEQRKRKLGTWRIVSGVLSVMLVCVASCAVAGLLGGARIRQLLGSPITTTLTPPPISYTNVPVTPVATPGPAANFVRAAVTAQGVDTGYNPINPTSHFTVNSDVYVVVQVRGVKQGETHTVSIEWYLDNINVGLPSSSNTSYAIHGDSNTAFALRYPTAGVGTARVYWDRPANDTDNGPNDKYLAQTIYFAVEVPAATTTPSKSAPKPTATPTPKKGDIGPAPVAIVGRPFWLD